MFYTLEDFSRITIEGPGIYIVLVCSPRHVPTKLFHRHRILFIEYLQEPILVTVWC